MDKTLLNTVFASAKNEGKHSQASVDAIKACKLDWTNAKDVEAVATSYKAGRIVNTLNLKSEVAALAILALKPHNDGAGDGHRTFVQHQAVRAAISTWSSKRMLAGAPNARTNAKRAPRASTANAEPASPLADTLLPAIVKAKSAADVHAYALRVASNVTKYINANAKFVTGDCGDVLRRFPQAIKSALEAGEVKAA